MNSYLFSHKKTKEIPPCSQEEPSCVSPLPGTLPLHSKAGKASFLERMISCLFKKLDNCHLRDIFCKMSDFQLKGKKVPVLGSNIVTSSSSSFQIKGPFLAALSLPMSWAPLPVSPKKPYEQVQLSSQGGKQDSLWLHTQKHFCCCCFHQFSHQFLKLEPIPFHIFHFMIQIRTD